MVLKLYGSWTAATQRVACVLSEKGVPYEMVLISLSKRENRSPEYLEKQPFGQIPFIVS
jgi:glutathione S-transferase